MSIEGAGGRPDWWRRGLDHVWLPYTQMKTMVPPVPVVATDGVELTLADGRTLIDGIASWWTACHGYNHPHIRAAVERQLATMPHVMFGGLAHEPAYRLAERLAGIAPDPLERVFFSESGSVSVEIAMKMAIQYWLQHGRPERKRFISFLGGYHGDTFGTMSVCDPEEGMHTLFGSVVPPQDVVPLPTGDAGLAGFRDALERLAPTAAAVVFEPLVQGAGGMRFHTPEALAGIVHAAREHGLLVIADEIFTGFGRTGTLFACEQAGIVPDVMTVSKSLTGGTMPLAATIASREVFEAFWSDDPEAALMHGPTFMGNPLGCAAAHASLDLFEQEPRLEQARAITPQLETGLEPCRELPGVRDVRVRGAIGAVELDPMPPLGPLKQALLDEGVWVRPFGNVVYLTPALTIDASSLATLTGAIVRVLRKTLG